MELRYPDSVEEAARIARVALPMAVSHHLAATPVNYAVLYEYVSGRNAALREAADPLFKHPDQLAQEKLTELFHRFVVQDNASVLSQLHGQVQSALIAALQSMGTHATESTRHQEQLKAGMAKLAGERDASAINAIIEGLIACTHTMLASGARMQQHLQVAGQELESLRAEFARNRDEAPIDALTGTHTRRAFEARLAQASDEMLKRGEKISVAVIDIDSFKALNEKHGHLVGDQIIKFVAKNIRDNLRDSDFLARFGGEEFAVILAGIPLHGAVTVAKNIVNRVARSTIRQKHTGERVGHVTVSAGVAELDPRESGTRLVNRAVTALYMAKRQGRNRVCHAAKEGRFR